MINVLVGLGIGAVVAAAATVGGVSVYQGSSSNGVPQSQLYSYADN
jgi:hypothetical protein